MLRGGETVTITQSAVSLEQLLGKFIFSVNDMKDAATQRSGTAVPAPQTPQK